MEKVLGIENPANLMTKHLDSKSVDKLMNKLRVHVVDGRAESGPQLNAEKVTVTGEGRT